METPNVKQLIEKELDEKDNVEKLMFARETPKELATVPLFSVSGEKVTINIQDQTITTDDNTSSKLSPDEHKMYYRHLKQTYQDDTYAKMAKEPYVEPIVESTDSIIQKLEKRVLELEKFIGFKSDGFANQICKCGEIATRHTLSGSGRHETSTDARFCLQAKSSGNECYPPEKIYVCGKYPECEIKPVIVVEPTKEEIAYDDFKKQVAHRAGISIILFYSREDPVCKELMSETTSAVWTTIKKMHEKHYAILIMEIDDSDNNKKIRDVCGVQSYPTIVKFMNGQYKKFNGDMSVHNIEQFISSMRF
jgi:hypothetical protein